MKSKIILIFLCMLLLVGTASAFNFDDVKLYEEQSQTVTIKDCSFWLLTCLIDGEDIAELKLNTPLVNYVPYGNDKKVAEFDAINYRDYNNALREIEFYDKNNLMEKVNRDFTYKVLSYNEVIIPANKTHSEQKIIEEVWTPLVKSNFLEGEVLTIGIFTDVYLGDNVEWIPIFYGMKIEEWATWESDSIIIDGLPDLGTNSNPSVFFKDESWFNIVFSGDGAGNGVVGGYVLAGNGTTWIANSTIIDGFLASDTGDERTADVFFKDESWFTIVGHQYGSVWAGFTLASNKTTWIANSTIVNGLVGVQWNLAPSVFFKDSSWYAITSYNVGVHDGYVWTGTGWTSNSTIIDGIAGQGYAKYSFFVRDGTQQLIQGGNDGDWAGYAIASNGTTWLVDTNIVDGLADVGTQSKPTVYEMSPHWFLISGSGAGTFAGFNITESVDASPTVTLNKPDNSSIFSINTVGMNCTVFDYVNLVNVSLILDGEINETNVSGINNSLYNFDKSLSAGNHNWTCRGADNNSQVTTAGVRFLNINQSVGTILQTPLDNQNFTTTLIGFQFNSSAINQNLVASNLTIWFSNGTLAALNGSGLSGSALVENNFTHTLLESSYIYTANTTGTINTNTTVNRSFTVHLTPTIIEITEPIGTFTGITTDNTFTLSWNVTEPGRNVTAHVTNCSFTYNGTQTYLANLTLCTETNTTTFTYEPDVNNLTFTVEEEFGFVTNATTEWNVTLFLNTEFFNTTSYETELNEFTEDITYNESLWSSIAANLYYNSTRYPATQVGTGNNINFTRIVQRLFTTPKIKPFFWNFRLTNTTGTFDFNTTSQNQTEQPIFLFNCNATVTTKFVNFSFKDEGNSSDITASIPTSTFVHTLGNFTLNKTLTYINTTQNVSFAFCFDPANRTLQTAYSIQYERDGYQQRITEDLDSWNSTMTTTPLFLLANADGIFVTFQVINQAEQPVENAIINATRILGGVETVVGTGVTNAAGTKTFFLNPNFEHTIRVFKTGFPQFSTVLFPTQTSFTINLGVGAAPSEEDYTKGITYTIFPKSGTLNTSQEFVFNFTLASSFWTVNEFAFGIRDEDGNIFANESASTNGGTVTTTLNTSTNTSLIMDFYWLIDGNFTNNTVSWRVYNDIADSSWSVRVFFVDLVDFLDEGMFGFDNFGLAIVTFLTIFIFTGIMSLRYGISSPQSIAVLMLTLIAFFDVGLGLMDNLNPVNAVPHFPTILVGIILVGVFIREGVR